MLVDILSRGVERGEFTVDDPRQLARALATMSTGISQWYSPAGTLTPSHIAKA